MIKESHLQEDVGIIALPRTVRAVINKKYIGFAQPLGKNLAQQIYDEAEEIIARDYPQRPRFQANVCHRSVGEKGIHGSSLDLNVIYNCILKQYGFSFTTLFERK